MGCEVRIRLQRGMPLVVNEAQTARICRSRAQTLLGADQVTTLPVDTISEDFSLYGQQVPACFIGIGTAEPEAAFHPLHSDRYFASDGLLPVGAAVFAEMALGLLNERQDEE